MSDASDFRVEEVFGFLAATAVGLGLRALEDKEPRTNSMWDTAYYHMKNIMWFVLFPMIVWGVGRVNYFSDPSNTSDTLEESSKTFLALVIILPYLELIVIYICKSINGGYGKVLAGFFCLLEFLVAAAIFVTSYILEDNRDLVAKERTNASPVISIFASGLFTVMSFILFVYYIRHMCKTEYNTDKRNDNVDYTQVKDFSDGLGFVNQA